ncbi:serine hydrolase domain-containing protein [Agaribacterium haliotis]|uniref:serine hydrolase domain-containing protein n=1 Tax=Agaribacterium haliotis TaxID=2013869 RepID=UPI000BB59685|nr:serine hydrolase [Agaribacterium haliotis]
MRCFLLAISAGLCLNAQAASFHPADQTFIDHAAKLGVPQDQWDQGEFAAATFPNAYKYTRHYKIAKGSLPPEKWQEGKALDLEKLKGQDADAEQDLYTILRDRLKNHSMVVLKGDTVVHQHFFNGMGPDSTHLDMSVTKSFTATLAGIAAAEGLLDMSKPLEHYLPEFKKTAFEGVSIQEIADMRSGLNIPTPPHKSWDPRLTQAQEWHGKNDSGLHGVHAYLLLIKDRKYAPGEVYQYQDPNTEILGQVVERVTNKSLANYLEEKIWKKIGAENDAYWMADPAKFVVASGGLNMSTRDLARVGRVIVNGGKNYKGEQIIPKQFLDDIWNGNQAVKAAWKKGKEYALANDAWYKDQYRVLNIEGHSLLVMIGIHGQVLAIDKESEVIIALNGGYPQTETPRMANLIFYQVIPSILAAVK